MYEMRALVRTENNALDMIIDGNTEVRCGLE